MDQGGRDRHTMRRGRRIPSHPLETRERERERERESARARSLSDRTCLGVRAWARALVWESLTTTALHTSTTERLAQQLMSRGGAFPPSLGSSGLLVFWCPL